jgi:hypothetical protein
LVRKSGVAELRDEEHGAMRERDIFKLEIVN